MGCLGGVYIQRVRVGGGVFGWGYIFRGSEWGWGVCNILSGPFPTHHVPDNPGMGEASGITQQERILSFPHVNH